MAVSQIILTNKEELSFTGEKFKGDGFYGYADGPTISSSCFCRQTFLDAHYKRIPGQTIGFPLIPTINTKYIEALKQLQTDTVGVTVTGNFVYLRARVDRPHLTSTVYNKAQHGSPDKVILI